MIKYFTSLFHNIKTKVTKSSNKTYMQGVDGVMVLRAATVHCSVDYDYGIIEVKIPCREPIIGSEYTIDLFTKDTKGEMNTLYRGKVKILDYQLNVDNASKALYKIFSWEADRKPKSKKNIRASYKLSGIR